MQSEYEFAVFCEQEQILPFFKHLTELGYTWASQTRLINEHGRATLVSQTGGDLFFLTHNHCVVHSMSSTMREAIRYVKTMNMDYGMITYDEYVCNGYSPFEIQPIDVMSVL